MTKDVKTERNLEMHVEVDAPIEAAWKALTEAEGLANWFSPIAKVTGPGLNSEVTVAWSEEKFASRKGLGTLVCRKFCCVTSRTVLPFQYSSGR